MARGSRHPDFKPLEASRPPFDANISAFHYTRAPNPDWTYGTGTNYAHAQASATASTAGHVSIDPFSGRHMFDNYKLLVSAITPRPIAFVSTHASDGGRRRDSIAYERNSLSRGDLPSFNSPLSESSSSSPTLRTNDAENHQHDMEEMPRTHLLDHPTDAEPPSDNASTLTSLVPPQRLLSHLVEIFFDFVHPQVRVLHRPSFLSWIENGNFASDSHSILLILAICGLAGRFSGRPENDSRFKYSKRCQRGKGFLTRANRLFQREVLRMENLELELGSPQKPTFRFIQATTLLAFGEITSALSSRAYSLVSTAVRLAYDCGLDEIDSNLTQLDFEANDHRAECVKKEELRRVWWAISDMENFVCAIKCRPRLIDWSRCKTRLPCDDANWFQGREVPSSFLPASVYDLRESLDLPAHISVMGQRILAMHLFANLAYLAANGDRVDGWHDPISAIEECVAAWRPNIARMVKSRQTVDPAEGSLSDALIAYLVLQTWDLSRERSTLGIPPANCLIHKSPKSRTFSKALYASDVVCSPVRDWPTDSMAPFFFIAPLLWAPACLQLLVKSSTAAWPELMERASLSLRILTIRIEQCADFWGLGLFYLASFSEFGKKLTKDPRGEGTPIVRHQHFPDFLDASFLRELSSIYFSNGVSENFSRDGDEVEQQRRSSNEQQILMQSNAFLETSDGPFGYMADNFNWIEINWEEISSWIATES
ncbi:fungal-specific transcription factor domain-containing protein [Aspergillus leporis]|uniref:Fungal-specific transcription factor domain-containing protein n=1 Tax=Aspergillus leporis TaxID=41062 RepID=A0A5N5X0V1_9EURO|nr:fungal-specific transcription factor domain-containing protein [Aspergillus leporis]